LIVLPARESGISLIQIQLGGMDLEVVKEIKMDTELIIGL
jgi:hypothetical protein